MNVDANRELQLFTELLDLPSPGGREERLAALVVEKVRALGHEPEIDGAGNVAVRLPGANPAAKTVLLAAHTDEIGMVVTGIDEDGRLRVNRSGGLHPYKIGERPVEIIGDGEPITGVLSFGSGHTGASADRAITWSEAGIITGLDPDGLRKRGVRVGSSAVPSRATRGPVVFGDEQDPLVGAWTFDDRMGVVILLRFLEELKAQATVPPRPTIVCFTVHEEGGCHGAKIVAHRERPEIFVAIDGCPIPTGSDLKIDGRPGIWSMDIVTHFDQRLIGDLSRAAQRAGTELQVAVYDVTASDASRVYEVGAAERVASFGYVRESSHGYEVARLRVFPAAVATLLEFVRELT